MEFQALWKARITTHDGESEYIDDIYIRGAKTEEDARKEAVYQARHWYGEEEAEPCITWGYNCQDVWDEPHGYRIIELESVQRIENLQALLDSLSVIEYKEIQPETAGK